MKQSSFRLAASFLTVALLFSVPVAAQDSLTGVLAQLLRTQQNEAASREELEEATKLVARIVEDFPNSTAAVSIIRGESFEGIDFSSFEERLQTAEAAPAAPAGQLPTFFAEQENTPTALTGCVATAFKPATQTEMRLKVTLAPEGKLDGLPALTSPEVPDQGVRGDYLWLVGALEGCTPLPWGPPGEYELAVSATGELSLTSTPAPAEIASAANPAFPSFNVTPQDGNTTGAATPAPLPNFFDPAAMPPATPETEELVGFDRLAIRDLQARLLVSGFDPNGVDGVLGRGARAALASWQGSVGLAPSGYMSAEQLQFLKSQSQAQLDLWLQDPANAERYAPTVTAAPKKQRKKRRVKVCNRNALGILYNCRFVLR